MEEDGQDERERHALRRESFLRESRMKTASIVLLLLGLAALYLLFVATFADDGMVGCSNVIQTRGGTICMDKAYMR